MKFFPLIFFLCSLSIYAQEKDTTFIDSLNVIPGSSALFDADTLSSDTTKMMIKDSTIQIDTLFPLYQNPFYNESYFINRSRIDLLDYRFTGDLFSSTGFSFLKDMGMIGQPSGLFLYGTGYAGIGFFSDGILYNNRQSSFLDLNLIQNEFIDSIEVIPLPRGFLYGPDNYIAAVNFIEKDFLTGQPYTRIKYYEGPSGEAFVDGIFNSAFLNRFNFTFDITNRNFDSLYTNSDFSTWQANVKLKYFLSNSINFTAAYSLVSSDAGLFGGVDVDSISKITSDINSILYQPLQAPVENSTLRQETSLDKFKIRMLGKFGKVYTDLNFYYHANSEKYSGIPSINEFKNYVWGASLKQSYSRSFFNIELNGVFEKRELNNYSVDTIAGYQRIKDEYDIFSFSPVLSLYLLDSIFIPSVFYKATNYSGSDDLLNGYGMDLTFKILNSLKLYLGISKFDFLNGQETDIYEAGVSIKSKRTHVDFKLYSRRNFYSIPLISPLSITSSDLLNNLSSADITGAGLSLKQDIWKIGLEGNTNYNSYERSGTPTGSEIKFYFNAGVFYKDILFNNNLDLKTGFVLKYYDFESDDLSSARQVDFTVAGVIQKVAIVYFSWENLFDEKYFIVPFYPMRERGVRFGLSWELFN